MMGTVLLLVCWLSYCFQVRCQQQVFISAVLGFFPLVSISLDLTLPSCKFEQHVLSLSPKVLPLLVRQFGRTASYNLIIF